MAKKLSHEKLKAVDQYINSLIEPIKKATSIGAWHGYDGASQFLNGKRLDWLKNKGDDVYNHALELCLNAIIDVTLVKKGEKTVLENFTKEHVNFIYELSKRNPKIFSDQEGRLSQICRNALPENRRKRFETNLSKAITSKNIQDELKL